MPSPASPYRPAPTGARLSDLTLVNLSADAPVSAVGSARPLGRREQVRALLEELLPGSSFEEPGRVTFTRDDYAIAIDLLDGDPVPSASLSLDGPASIVAMRRLLRRTGWRIFDPARREFIALEVLGSALAQTGTAGTPQAIQPRAASEIAHHPWEATAESARRYGRLIVGLIVLVAVSGTLWWATRRDPIEFNERQTIHELNMLGTANLSLRAATGAYTSPDQLASPDNATRLGASALPPFFATHVRNGYRFEMQGEPVTDDDRTRNNIFPMLEPAYISFIYVALPVEPGVTGRRSFAYHSEQVSIYARDDVSIPTPDDERVPMGR